RAHSSLRAGAPKRLLEPAATGGRPPPIPWTPASPFARPLAIAGGTVANRQAGPDPAGHRRAVLAQPRPGPARTSDNLLGCRQSRRRRPRPWRKAPPTPAARRRGIWRRWEPAKTRRPPGADPCGPAPIFARLLWTRRV